MAETCPRNGFKEVSVESSGLGLAGGDMKGGTRSSWDESNTSPAKKRAGNVSWLELNSLWPKSQNSAGFGQVNGRVSAFGCH